MSQEIKDPSSVVVKIDAALKRLYAQAISQLDDAKSAGAASWHKKYEIVSTIIEHVPPMYLAGGFATEGEFFAAQLEETAQSTYRHIRVAKLTTIAEVTKYSVTRLSLAIAYVEATSRQPVKDRGGIDFDSLKIQFKRDGKVTSKSLKSITYAELNQAVTEATGHADKPARQSPAAKAVNAAVKASGVKEAKATVTKTMVTIRVPLTGLGAVARELADFKVPTQ